MEVSEEKRKKILIFSIAYIPFVGGAELAVKEITDRIGDCHFDLITLRLSKELPKAEKIGNVIVHRVSGPKLLFPFTALFKGLSLHKKYKYEIVWSLMANRAGFAALFFKFLHPETKYLLTLQEGDVLEYPKKRAGILWLFVGFLFRKIFTKADCIQVISRYLAKWAMSMGAKKNRIAIVPNGVDLEKFQFQPRRPSGSGFRPEASEIPNSKINDLRKKLGIRHDDKVLITTSRLVEKNAVGDVIEALKHLPENTKFLILGTGPLEEKLKLQVTGGKLQGRVAFLGHIEPEYVPQYLAISNIFIRPSLSEGLGNSFLEAMAAGLPVIATPVGGIPDFLIDPSNSSGQVPTGLFCEVKNPQDIAEKVKIFLQNGALRNQIIKNAQEMILRDYDWNLIAERMKDIFEKLFI